MRSRLADAATERLGNPGVEEPPITEAEMMRLLAGIARRGKPADRLRAIEMLGKQMGLFREKAEAPDPHAHEKAVARLMQRLAALRPPTLTVVPESSQESAPSASPEKP